MVNDAALYMRAFPGDRRTLCTEPVLQWLAAHGLEHSFDARTQRALFKRVGFWRAVAEVARRLGLQIERPRNLVDGEAIIFRAGDEAIAGIYAGGFCLAWSSGLLYAARRMPAAVIRRGSHA